MIKTKEQLDNVCEGIEQLINFIEEDYNINKEQVPEKVFKAVIAGHRRNITIRLNNIKNSINMDNEKQEDNLYDIQFDDTEIAILVIELNARVNERKCYKEKYEEDKKKTVHEGFDRLTQIFQNMLNKAVNCQKA